MECRHRYGSKNHGEIYDRCQSFAVSGSRLETAIATIAVTIV